ncbi:hypothetical protein BD769DRAFT_1385338 [Suillus cothurnatus]|nr:hypothetical protein BD769DRAFT_1385338 [Suillus cothurnatus]
MLQAFTKWGKTWQSKLLDAFRWIIARITTIDVETGSIELCRWRARINNYMDLILFLMQSNTDTQFIGSGEAAKAAVFYITEYITKGSLPMYIGIQALEYAMKMHKQKFESLEDATVDQKNHNLITKSVNAMMGQQEISHQQVMSYLVGGGDFYVSHTFQTVRWYEFVQAADRLDREMMDDENEEQYGESEDSPIQEEQVTVNVMVDGVEVTSNIEDYTLQKTIKEQDNKPLEESVDTEDSNSDIASVILLKKRGRKRLLLCMRNKAVVPVLLGEAISGKDGGEKEYENYCCCMMILFKPWHNLKCLKGGYKTWMEAFEKKECKEPRDAHAALVRERCIKPHAFGHSGALDDGEMVELVESKSHVQSIVEVDKNAGDIQTCLRAASDGGVESPVELLTEDNRGHMKEFASIMKALKKRKRPIDVGTAHTEVKHARLAETEDEPSISLQQMEEDAEITSVYYKPEITDHQQESILTEIIDEFKHSDNAEQEMCLRLIGEHFIHGDVKQLLMFITGIGGSGKSHVIQATVEMF